jgi:hypothetical protein
MDGFPILSDGRTFTDYTQNSIRQEKLKKEYGIPDNQTYRDFLTKNADRLMERSMNEARMLNSTQIYPLGKIHPPYRYSGIMDETEPPGYVSSEMKNVYLSREKLNSLRTRKFIQG